MGYVAGGDAFVIVKLFREVARDVISTDCCPEPVTSTRCIPTSRKNGEHIESSLHRKHRWQFTEIFGFCADRAMFFFI